MHAYKRRLKRYCIALISAALLCSAPSAVAAKAPYESYTYNYYEEAVPAPDAFLPDRSISGVDLGIGGFVSPQDIFVSSEGKIYIADTGNHRIIVLNEDWTVDRIFSNYSMDGAEQTFNMPSGITVNKAGDLYIADTENKRIVVLSPEGEWIKTIENPQSEVLGASFSFVPLKLAVDDAGRVFVTSRGAYEGILQFDESGEFIGYVGTIQVRRNFVDYLWRLIATDAQKNQMALYIPTEFSNIDMGEKGFVYATNIDPGSSTPIKRLNPSGEDVLKRYGYFDVKGDIRYRSMGVNGGPSKLVDIKYQGNGMYSVLDSLRGRIFTYDHEGNLLYIYGGIGTQVGTFSTPVAIEKLGNQHVVLDQGKETITLFSPTSYGSAINDAVTAHYNGDDEASVAKWREVLRLNANYDIAYIGIGKSLLYAKENKEAMEHFKLGMDRKNYSVAFKRYRKEVLQEHFGTILTIGTTAVIVFAGYRWSKSWRKRRKEQHEAGFY
ncbi:NHL repeat-containing protein [Paenibacillus sp. PDC88]|uniref:NHL repeat-containing protein n=1 Tax=Paenibacillus TaxID=44249 RepID=UPI00089485CC|nr:NHL repeat-containing protein [Paenibacillus sp. PDC88]SDW11632.1 NHL repeat-containing protein [Paenibacillus sp. PDC88]